jgi:hypothetical protein
MYKIIGADQVEYGPVSTSQMRQWLAEGRVNAATPVLPEGAAAWVPLGQVPELSGMLPMQPVTPRVLTGTVMGERRLNVLALVSFCVGLASLLTGWCCCCLLPLPLVGIILACVAIAQINGNGERETGKGFAIAGLVLSIVSVFAFVFLNLVFHLVGAGLNLPR